MVGQEILNDDVGDGFWEFKNISLIFESHSDGGNQTARIY